MVPRGWSPSDAQRRIASLVVGLLLVFNPVYLGLMGVGGPTYRYERVPVETAGRTFAYDPDDATSLGEIRGVDCTDFNGGRRCYFDELLAERGNVTVAEHDPGLSARPDEPYAVVERQVYRRTVERVNDSAIRFGLVPVTAEEMLRDVAVPVERAQPPVRRAVRTGATHTEYEDRFVRTEDGYYLFTQAGRSTGWLGRWVIYGVGVAVGLGALRRAARLGR